ncbi:Ribonuclease H domain [Sesbania bispinosa]|nr:Ribonuclease H domain [Sesbania bispinosa]
MTLSHKYLRGGSILGAKADNSESFIWKGILKAKEALRNGFMMKLGTSQISVWYDDWTGLGKLCDLVPYVHISDSNLLVNDLWRSGTWSLDHLATVIPNEVKHVISCLPIPTENTTMSVGWHWKFSLDGLYSSKHGYSWLQNHDHDMHNSAQGIWRWIWHLAAPEKVRFMLWLALHDSLPTKEVLHRRHISDSALCPRCTIQPESIIHCLRDCSKARLIWDRLGFTTQPHFFDHDLMHWLKKHAKHSSEILFLATIWWIWLWRNKEVFDTDRWEIEFIIRQILLMKSEVTSTLQSDPMQNFKNWWSAPPPANFVKLNIDGGFRLSEDTMSVGGVLRDSTGNWCGGFAGNAGAGDVLLAELLALKIGLDFAWNIGYRRILCESDSLEVVHLLSCQILPTSAPHQNTLRETNDLLNRNWDVNIKHIMREANLVADNLAKTGSAEDSLSTIFWSSPPAHILSLLHEVMPS